ncbi:MAG TPA: heavy metal-binding domain-containing protein [Syntrophomonas sp.]|nr:heavy metal-binding domain-containing protein [Syntrophomonas sp.]
MIITTSQTVQNRSILNYLGLVSGESILGPKFMETVLNGVSSPQGCTGACKPAVEEARQAALEEMKIKAVELGAEAIIAVDIDYVELKDQMLLIAVSGTAVKLVEYRD